LSKMGYIRIIRPSSCIMVSLISVIGQAFALGRTPELFTAIPAFLTGFFMTGSSFSINDYIDHEIDSINTPWRPIPSGLITRDEALRIGIVLGLSGSIISLFTTPPASIVAIGALLFSILYTLKGKYLGILGHIMVAISISSTFIFGALTIMQNITPIYCSNNLFYFNSFSRSYDIIFLWQWNRNLFYTNYHWNNNHNFLHNIASP